MMKKLLSIVVIATAFAFSTNAQVTLWDNSEKSDTTSIKDESFVIPESLDQSLDNLFTNWNSDYYTKRNQASIDVGSSVVFSDSVYIDRLSRLPRIMEMPYNDVVRRCIDLYVERRRTMVSGMLGLADVYFPMIEKALDENGLPIELKYLAVVESALNPVALSRAGACGLWQFMLPTGKIYGLEINSLVDERRDPVKATYAACHYFKDMYEIYKDWNLVIAAYNCGPGNVNKAIKRAGGKTDYWAIYDYLPRETRSYVPLFIAANYAMNYYGEHNISPYKSELPLATDTVMINKQLHFGQIADVLNLDKNAIIALNPQYKREIIPGNVKPSPLCLPAAYAYAFVGNEDSIFAHKSDEYFTNRAIVGPNSEKSSSSSERVIYKVKKGESLAHIANNFGVTTTQVRKWNRLKSNRVVPGRSLTLYVDNGGYEVANKSSSSNENKQITAQAETSTSKSKGKQEKKSSVQTTENVSSKKSSHGKYKVRQGDSFYTISKRYPGTSAKDLMKMNNMNNSSLKVGQVIKVPVV